MRTGHLPRLDLPVLQTRRAEPLTQHRRLELLRRVLTDERGPLRARVAACLMLLFAQPASRIVRVTIDDITRTDAGQVLIRLGDPPTPVPEPFAALLLQAAAQRDNMQTATNPDARRLFPGRRVGQPLTPGMLAVLLRELGVPAAAGRTAALRQLERAAAADLRAAGRSWAAVGRALGITKQSAHQRLGGPPGPAPADRQEVLTEPAGDRAPTAAGQPAAEVDAARGAGRQDPLTGSPRQPGQDPSAPIRRRPAAPRPTTSAPAYDLVKAGDHATTGRWLVTVDGQPVGSVRREVTAWGTRRWAAWLGDTRLALHRTPGNRQDAAAQVLMAHNAGRSRRR